MRAIFAALVLIYLVIAVVVLLDRGCAVDSASQGSNKKMETIHEHALETNGNGCPAVGFGRGPAKTESIDADGWNHPRRRADR
jgi:hypothetical protein